MTNIFDRLACHRPLRNSALLMAGVATAMLALPAAAGAQNADSAAGADQSAAPALADAQEIIVTANRRAERLQDVPVQITAFSEQRLQQQGIRNEQDLQASVPSLTVGPNGQGVRDAPSFTIRGLGATFQASPGVVVYLNEVPLPSPLSLSQQGGPGNFVDIENLEILAGPQGTLFGRNTTGGAVLIVPRKPTNDLGGWIQGRFGNYDDREIEGAINLPVVDDKLMVRVSGAYHDRDGYTHDVIWDKDRDNTHWYSGRIGILARPVEGVENYLMAYGSYSRNNGGGLIHKGFNIPGLEAATLCSEAAGTCAPYHAADAQANALGPRATAFSDDVRQKTRTAGITNTTTVELSDQIKLRNIASYQVFKGYFSYDGDATVLQQHDVDPTRLPVPGQATLPGTNTPLTYLNATGPDEPARDDFRTLTEELQLQGNAYGNKLTYTVGGFYFDQKPTGPQIAHAVVYCPPAFTGFCPANTTGSGVRQKSKALYAQATLDLGALSPVLDKLRLTGGYRHTWDTIDGFAYVYSPSQTTPGSVVCGSTGTTATLADATTACRFDGHLKSQADTWTVGLDYRISSDLLVFAKANRGYKSGGFNPYSVFPNTRTFAPEFVTDYEAGFKSNFKVAGMPTRFNATAYYMNYKGIQRASGDFNPATGGAGAKTVNGDAHVKGIELDASVRPIPQLELGGNFSYTDAKYTKYQFVVNGFFPQASCNGLVNPGSVANMKCLPFQYATPYVWSAHAALDLPLPNDLATLSVFVNYSHASSQYTEASQLESVQPGARIASFGLLNLSVDLKNIAKSNVDVGFFATNLTNKLYRTSNTDVYQAGSLLYWSTLYGEPRMYGLRVRYHFGAGR